MARVINKEDTLFFRRFLEPALAAVDRGDEAALKREVREELSRIAFSSIQDICEYEDGTLRLKASADLSREQLAAVSSVKMRKTRHGGMVVEVDTWPKLKALELLGRHLGMFVDRMAVEVNETKARAYARRVVEIVLANVQDPDALAAIQDQVAKLEAVGDA